MLEIGKKAPDFTAQTQNNTSVKLSDFLGKKVVLYFYPKDNTPGCTKQACNLRDHWSQLQAHGIQVLGVSKDSVASHEKFATKFELPFPLISDPETEINQLYGVWKEKNMYGRKYMGTARTTFLIDESGILVDIIKKPKVSDHTAEILTRFEKV